MTEARDFITMLAQGQQKVAGIKIIGGECVNRYKNMSYSQINSLIKAVQDEKLTKMIKQDRLLLALPFRKFRGVTVDGAYPDRCSRTGFHAKTMSQSTPPPQSWSSNVG
jgi:hypothetical protein